MSYGSYGFRFIKRDFILESKIWNSLTATPLVFQDSQGPDRQMGEEGRLLGGMLPSWTV